MRCFNFRYLCSLRKVRNFLILSVMLVIIVNLVIITSNGYPKKHISEMPTKQHRSRDYKVIYTKLRTKIPCPSKLQLLILVSSNLGHTDRRALIRKTWGSDSSISMRWRTVFLLTENNNQKEKRISLIESDLYGDLIRGDYQESFFNMAFKVAMGFEWALKFCNFDYLLKTDDDIFVNTKSLIEYLNLKTTLKTKLYTGNPMVGSPVLRVGRYRVMYQGKEKRDDATNKTVFDPYCSGGGFLLSNDVVRGILDHYDLEHPLNIDDAYIGELALRAGVKPLIDSKHFKMYADKCVYDPNAFVQHPAKGVCMEELHRKHLKYLLTGELETPKPTPPPTPAPKPKAPQNPPQKPEQAKKDTPKPQVAKKPQEKSKTQEQPKQQPAQPTQPKQQPAQPTQQPTQPKQQPAQPTQQPTQPKQQPAQPTQQPTQPKQQPAQPTQPKQQPAQPTQQPAQPKQQPAQPTQPKQQPAQPQAQPTKPPTQPLQQKNQAQKQQKQPSPPPK